MVMPQLPVSQLIHPQATFGSESSGIAASGNYNGGDVPDHYNISGNFFKYGNQRIEQSGILSTGCSRQNNIFTSSNLQI
jgi:hypothetical protein